MRYIVKIRQWGELKSEYASGRRHKSLERAAKEAEDLKMEFALSGRSAQVYVVERPCISSDGAVRDIISICQARGGERCRNCVASGEPCEDLKRIYWVSKPMDINLVDWHEETEDQENGDHKSEQEGN